MFPSGKDIVDYDLDSIIFAFRNNSDTCFFIWCFLVFISEIFAIVSRKAELFTGSFILLVVLISKYSHWISLLKNMWADIEKYYPDEKNGRHTKAYYIGLCQGLVEACNSRILIAEIMWFAIFISSCFMVNF